MLLAGIFPAKQTPQKLVECSEISSSMIETHKKPSEPITISLLGSSKKIANSYGDETVVKVFRCDAKYHDLPNNQHWLIKNIIFLL
jgi:hypothetical protein